MYIKKGHRQVVENSMQYLLGRTDILQNTVVGCPWTVLRLSCYCQNPWFRFSTRTSSVAELDLHLVSFKRNFNFFLFCIVAGTVLSVWISEWKIENYCFQEPITYTECAFRSSSARSVFYWNAFRENSSFFFTGRVRGLLKISVHWVSVHSL